MILIPKRLRLILLGLLGLVVLVFLITIFFGLSLLSRKSQKLVDIKLQSKTVDAQLTGLEQVKKQVGQYAYFNDVAKTVIPNDKDQAQAVLDIFQLADQSGIAIGSVTFPASTLGAAPSSASAPSSSASAISQAKPVQGINGLYALELTIVPQVGPLVPAAKTATYPKFLDFLGRIEHDRRTAQITQISIQPQGTVGSDQTINFSLTINIFIRPTQ